MTNRELIKLLKEILFYLDAQTESQQYDASPDDSEALADELRLFLSEEINPDACACDQCDHPHRHCAEHGIYGEENCPSC